MDKALLSCVIKRNKDDTYTFIGSDETLDRDGEVIKVDGWQLGNYKKNPVVLWGHNHYIPAIGKSERTYKEDGKLKFKVRFAQEGVHDLADTVKALIDDEILKSVSVGYIALKREYPSDEDDTKAKQPRVITTKAELYELSVVNVPANQNALISSMKEKGYEQKTIDLVTGETECLTVSEGPDPKVKMNVTVNGKDFEKVMLDAIEEPTLDDVLGAISTIYDRIEDLEKRVPEIVQEAFRNKSIYTGLFAGGDKAEKPAEKKQNPFHPTKKGNSVFKG